MNSVRVRVPASTANLGPGFDTLGCALSIYNTFLFESSDTTVIQGCPPRFAGEDNLTLRAFRAAEKRAGRAPSPVRITETTRIPTAGGLGTSATFAVGGAMGANLLLGLGLTREDIFAIACDFEGHPDNVAPAVYGGLTAAMMESGAPYATRLPIDPAFHFMMCIPDMHIDTHSARRVLPASYSRADAVYTSSHAVMLTAALAKGDAALLSLALRDRMHEPYRRPLIRGFEEMEKLALGLGAHAFCISGSGATCLAIFTGSVDEFSCRMREGIRTLSDKWRVLPLHVDLDGAKKI